MENKKVILADITRSPWGKPCGSTEKFLSSDLSAAALRLLLKRTGVQPETVGQVVFGQAHPTTFPNNIGHFAWLKAELPVTVPGYTVQENTASALQALRSAYYLIASGNEDIVIAGGADSYSAAPFVMRDVRNHFDPKDRWVIDTLDEAECCTQPEPMSRREQYEKAHGAALSEKDIAFAAESREKAKKLAAVCGDTVAPVSYTDRKKGEIVISGDEWLGDAEPVKDALAPYADGAAVALLLSEDKAKELGLAPMAELLGFAVVGGGTETPEQTGAAAVKKLLAAQGKTADDLACLEIIENSAEDVFETAAAIGGKAALNPFGGALAFGKNDGAEGVFMLQRLCAALKPGQLGAACIYSAGGIGMAALLQRR